MIPTSLMKGCISTILCLKYFIFFQPYILPEVLVSDKKLEKIRGCMKARLAAEHKHWS